MTERNPMQDGAEKRLYDDRVTPRASPVFSNWGKAIWLIPLKKILDAVFGPQVTAPEKRGQEQRSYKPGYQETIAVAPAPAYVYETSIPGAVPVRCNTYGHEMVYISGRYI